MLLGIDFGTSYTKLAGWHENRLINLAGPQRRIPSVVGYLPSTGRLYFGERAWRLRETGSVIVPLFKLELKHNPGLTVGPFTLPEVLHQYFLFLHTGFIASYPDPPTAVALSVPNYFGLRARKLLLDAARSAFDLAEVYLVPEPVAALLGYNCSHPAGVLEGDILCIDMGGGTSDFSILSLYGNRRDLLLEAQFQVGHDTFSGSEIDRAIVHRIFIPAFQMQTGVSLPDRLWRKNELNSRDQFWLNRIYQTAEAVKIQLSRQNAACLDIPDFWEGHSLVIDIDRKHLLHQLTPIFARLQQYFSGSVEPRARQLGLLQPPRWNLDYILLLGGASSTPGVTEFLCGLCPGVKIIQPQEKDFNVAAGLCTWLETGGVTAGRIRNLYPFEFYIEKTGDEGQKLVKVPFDTRNLELEFNGRYRIFSFSAASEYNLALRSGELHCRVYEAAEEDQAITAEKFLEQEILLDYDQENLALDDKVELFLNFKNASLELEVKGSVNNQVKMDKSWWDGMRSRQNQAVRLLKIYPLNHPPLAEDCIAYLSQRESREWPEYKFYEPAALYKALVALSFFRPG